MKPNNDKAREAWRAKVGRMKFLQLFVRRHYIDDLECNFIAGYQAAQQANAEVLREVLSGLEYMIEDMKSRMDIDYDNREMHKKICISGMCSGEKNEDGSYTFPMGTSAFIALDGAIDKLKQLIGDV